MKHFLENEALRCGISEHGAELKSIRDKAENKEYLWQADPAYWNRTSPILFPFVGAVWEGVYRHEGKEYRMTQHGFARDMDFRVVKADQTSILFEVSDTEETRKVYPFAFGLQVGYRLEKTTVFVDWKVENRNEGDMYYSIGAHPGFSVSSLNRSAFLLYDTEGKPLSGIKNRIVGSKSCISDTTEIIPLKDGMLPLSVSLFDKDALVLEDGQVGCVELCALSDNGEIDPNAKKIAVTFDMPLVGLWSPPKMDAPFVCIEPWIGRCDREGFAGELAERDYEQKIKSGESFTTSYSIGIR